MRLPASALQTAMALLLHPWTYSLLSNRCSPHLYSRHPRQSRHPQPLLLALTCLQTPCMEIAMMTSATLLLRMRMGWQQSSSSSSSSSRTWTAWRRLSQALRLTRQQRLQKQGTMTSLVTLRNLCLLPQVISPHL